MDCSKSSEAIAMTSLNVINQFLKFWFYSIFLNNIHTFYNWFYNSSFYHLFYGWKKIVLANIEKLSFYINNIRRLVNEKWIYLLSEPREPIYFLYFLIDKYLSTVSTIILWLCWLFKPITITYKESLLFSDILKLLEIFKFCNINI